MFLLLCCLVLVVLTPILLFLYSFSIIRLISDYVHSSPTCSCPAFFFIFFPTPSLYSPPLSPFTQRVKNAWSQPWLHGAFPLYPYLHTAQGTPLDSYYYTLSFSCFSALQGHTVYTDAHTHTCLHTCTGFKAHTISVSKTSLCADREHTCKQSLPRSRVFSFPLIFLQNRVFCCCRTHGRLSEFSPLFPQQATEDRARL